MDARSFVGRIKEREGISYDGPIKVILKNEK
jgi:hypothetical protein